MIVIAILVSICVVLGSMLFGFIVWAFWILSALKTNWSPDASSAFPERKKKVMRGYSYPAVHRVLTFENISSRLVWANQNLDEFFAKIHFLNSWSASPLAKKFRVICFDLQNIPDSRTRQNLMLEEADMDAETRMFVKEYLTPEANTVQRLKDEKVGFVNDMTLSPVETCVLADIHDKEKQEVNYWDIVRASPKAQRLACALENMDDWDCFDIYRVRSLVAPGSFFGLVFHRVVARMNLCCQGDLLVEAAIPKGILLKLLNVAEERYCFSKKRQNPYHDEVHGADVLCTFATILSRVPEIDKIPATDVFVALMAALMHDYRHPGVNNQYLVNSRHNISFQYADDSVLERFHTAQFLMLADETDLFCNQSHANVNHLRRIIAQTILATDLSKSMFVKDEFKKNFKGKFKFSTRPTRIHHPPRTLPPLPSMQSSSVSPESIIFTDGILFREPESVVSAFKMILACADVSHACKSRAVHMRQSALVLEEFAAQGRKEVENSLPLSPLCRPKKDVAPSQCGFIKFVVLPKFEALSCIFGPEDAADTKIGYGQWMRLLRSNLKYWSGRGCSASALRSILERAKCASSKEPEEDIWKKPMVFLTKNGKKNRRRVSSLSLGYSHHKDKTAKGVAKLPTKRRSTLNSSAANLLTLNSSSADILASAAPKGLLGL